MIWPNIHLLPDLEKIHLLPDVEKLQATSSHWRHFVATDLHYYFLALNKFPFGLCFVSRYKSTQDSSWSRAKGGAAMSLSAVRESRNSIGRRSGGANGPSGGKSGCETINLLAFLEEENRDLRRAAIELALDTLRLKSALRGNER
jgi:hypothetical protein